MISYLIMTELPLKIDFNPHMSALSSCQRLVMDILEVILFIKTGAPVVNGSNPERLEPFR